MSVQKNGGILSIEGPEYKLEESKNFNESYFRREYRQAFEVVGTIARQTVERKQNSKKGEAKNQIQNIVPFIGKRGSGKTSAMMSFAFALENYDQLPSEYKNELCRGMQMDNVDLTFIRIDCIDGSLLEQGEDIFKIILAQMFAKYEYIMDRAQKDQSRDFEYKRRELQQQFETLYRNACKMERAGNDELYTDESAILSLKSLSSSLSIKASFKNLVQSYLGFLMNMNTGADFGFYENYRGNGYPFLVISIDDLDLNISNGFDMLEKIHRYMMVDNVIVLLAVDYDQLKLLCEQSFFRIIPKFDSKLNEKYKEVERLARDFLDKVLSANERIYVPELKRTAQVMIQNPDGSGQSYGVRETLFSLLYRKFGMRMDVEGDKRHFYEQNSLRALINFYLMLYEMNDLEVASDKMEVFENNYKILMSDTITRMIDERLGSESKEVFQRIIDRNLPYSARSLYFEMLKMKREDGKEEKTGTGTNSLAHSLKNLIDNLEFYGYSYGEILRTVYCWGRVDEEGKEMVRCLLAFYSLELTRSYYRYRLEDEKNNAAVEKEKRKKVFVRVMNGTIAGSWANKMFPRFFSSHEHPYRDLIGARTDVKLERVFRLKITLGKCFHGKADKDGKFRAQDIQKNPSLMDEMKKIFRSVLVLGMFFERQYYKVDKAFMWNLQVPERSSKVSDFWKAGDDLSYGDTDVDICCSSGTGFFNLFSFVSNAFQYEENVKTLMLSLYQNLFVETDEDSRMGFMKKLGIEQEFLNWHRYSGGFALPIYDMDLCYNLMKRVRQREMPDEISDKNYGWEEYVKILRFIKEKLVGNDKWYKDIWKDQESGAIQLAAYGRSGGQQGYHIRFADAFCKCPYLAWILDEDDGMLVNGFPQLFQNMLELLVVKGNSNAPQSDDKEYSGYDD